MVSTLPRPTPQPTTLGTAKAILAIQYRGQDLHRRPSTHETLIMRLPSREKRVLHSKTDELPIPFVPPTCGPHVLLHSHKTNITACEICSADNSNFSVSDFMCRAVLPFRIRCTKDFSQPGFFYMIVRMFCKARLLYVMMSVSLSMCFLFSVRGLGYDDGGRFVVYCPSLQRPSKQAVVSRRWPLFRCICLRFASPFGIVSVVEHCLWLMDSILDETCECSASMAGSFNKQDNNLRSFLIARLGWSYEC